MQVDFNIDHKPYASLESFVSYASDIDCLKRKLSSKLSAGEDGRGPEWEVYDYNLEYCKFLNSPLIYPGWRMPRYVVETWLWVPNLSIFATKHKEA